MSPPPSNDNQVVWLNGLFVPAGEAAISPWDRGFLYGDGLFETMRAEDGRVLYLQDHLDRLNRSAAHLRIECDFSRDWQALFRELLHRNHLASHVAVAKIVLTRGGAPGMGLPFAKDPTLCLMVQEYQGPDDAAYERGWRLRVFREGYAPALARHKSLNYLYYLLARQYAVDGGSDEAVILDAVGNVAETAAGSLLIMKDSAWWRPASPCQLHGTTIQHISCLLEDQGYPVSPRDFAPEELQAADRVWVLNSLMGIMPVIAIEGCGLPSPGVESAARVRGAFFERGRAG